MCSKVLVALNMQSEFTLKTIARLNHFTTHSTTSASIQLLVCINTLGT
jgi:hypothetical protein